MISKKVKDIEIKIYKIWFEIGLSEGFKISRLGEREQRIKWMILWFEKGIPEDSTNM